MYLSPRTYLPKRKIENLLSLNSFTFFPFLSCNSLPVAGSSVSRVLAASGSRFYVSRAIRHSATQSSRVRIVKMIILAVLPFTGSITTRCENQSFAWRKLRSSRLFDNHCCRGRRVKRCALTKSFLEVANADIVSVLIVARNSEEWPI